MGQSDTIVAQIPQAARTVVESGLRQERLKRRVRERLEMVKGAALGQSLAEIARWSGRTERTVAQWLGRYVAGGVAALADAPRPGRPPQADAGYRAALETAMATAPRALGLSYDHWTSARLSAYLAEQTQVVIAPSWVRSLLKRQEFVTGRPKHTLDHLQDPAEVAACEGALAEAEKKDGRRAGAL